MEQSITIIKVIKVFSKDKVQERFVEQNMKLMQVLAQNRVQRRFVEQNTTIVKVIKIDPGSEFNSVAAHGADGGTGSARRRRERRLR